MAGALKLESFEDLAPRRPDPAAPGSAQMADPAEEERQASWEAGYKAGWDDAVKAQQQDLNRIRADFAMNLQELGFTYHEARSHILRSLEPLLSEISVKLLPAMAAESLAPWVVEELMAMAQDAADVPIQIMIAPEARPSLERLLDETVALPIVIVEEDSLDAGQAILRLARGDLKVDLDGVVRAVRDAIAAMYEINMEEVRRHG